MTVRVKRNAKGQSVTEQARLQSLNGFTVWRSWDEAGGIRDELYQLAAANQKLVHLEVLGHTHQGREIIAMRLTDRSEEEPPGGPLLLAAARAGVDQRRGQPADAPLLHRQYNAKDKVVRDVLKDSDLWFVLVANPDGYQYTFDAERLWRKNLRDNDNDNADHRGRRRRPQPQLRQPLGL